MKTKKILSLALAGVMALALAVPALADDTETKTSDTGSLEHTMPVNITATATNFSVTLPTALPTAITADGEPVPATATITNNSSGSIYVSSITVNKYAGGTNKTDPTAADYAPEWTLDAYDVARRDDPVDSHTVGVQVVAAGGRYATKTANATVATDSSDTATQTILSTKENDWVLDAKNGTDSDELTVTYKTYSAPVSRTFSGQVASIVIVVAWNNTADA